MINSEMSKYILKQNPVEAYQFKLGTEDYWCVSFEGCLYTYFENFDTKQEAEDYIKQNKGVEKLYDDDIDSEITYNKPMAIITLDGYIYDVREGDYIVIGDNGKRKVVDKVKFEKNYESVKE
jgi:hypothetical protein